MVSDAATRVIKKSQTYEHDCISCMYSWDRKGVEDMKCPKCRSTDLERRIKPRGSSKKGWVGLVEDRCTVDDRPDHIISLPSVFNSILL